jgi:uncharacterized membrane protein YhfC
VKIDPAYLATSVCAISFVVVYPVVLMLVARRWLRVGLRYAGYGALVFLVFQIATRTPLVELAQRALALELERSSALRFGWLVVISLSAALFEETGRYVAFRWLLRREPKTWAKAVMYGIGHGGLESIAIGAVAAATLLSLLAVASKGPETLPIEQRGPAAEQLARIAAAPALLPLLSAWERLFTVPIQIGLSVLVMQVFLRGSFRWLGLAIMAHTLVNLLAIGALQLFGPDRPGVQVAVELMIAGFGLGALWVTWRLRDPTAVPA